MFTLKVDKDLELHLFQPHHAEELFWLINRNREYLREWLPWVDDVNSPARLHQVIPMWLRQFANNEGLNAGIRFRGVLIGSVSINSIDWNNRSTVIGYYLDQQASGKGIMTRCVEALINYIFHQLKLNRIEARCGEHNIKSRAIPERIGFITEGKMRQGEYLNGRFHDLIIYSLLAKEWNLRNR